MGEINTHLAMMFTRNFTHTIDFIQLSAFKK